jgi:NAD(P)-dependent dehydrogenase (short-subunit alcohol dehydrogenase family)
MAAGERLLDAVLKTFFGPMRVSVMLDSNGANTTAVAASARLQQAVGDLSGRVAVVLAGSGPVGTRVGGLLAKAGAQVVVTSRKQEDGRLAERIRSRFGGTVRDVVMRDAGQAADMLEGAQLVVNAGPAGVRLVPREAWAGRPGLLAIADLNAVPPLGVEGVEITDNAAKRGDVTVFGALGVGSLKMKVHKACIARLFERNDAVLDAETIADVARELIVRQA